MCGIVAYLGKNEAAPILLEALRKMEYRGYDSAGIATLQNGNLHRRRAVGKLASLSNLLVRDPIRGLTGIGHTRWATHGRATQANAHPHQSSGVAVVHNGIIENFMEIRAELGELGITHATDTDTESVALLCQHLIDQGLEPAAAARQTVLRLEGNFALAFIFKDQDHTIIAARQRSPLVVGHGSEEMSVASDVIALAGLADRVSYLEDGDLAVITRDGLTVYDRTGQKAARSQERIDVDLFTAGKGGHKHFMAKEIYEQPRSLADAVGKLDFDGRLLAPDAAIESIVNARRIELIGCGTASYACQIAGYWFENLAGIQASCTVASEFICRHGKPDESSLGIFVSQSGETADTLAALRHMRGHGCGTVAVLNVMTSTMSREADEVIPINAGIEISVASTKAFTCQLVALAALAISAGRRNGRINEQEYARLLAEFARLPGLASAAINSDSHISSVAREIGHSSCVLYIGRGTMFPLALEGALKLKEISYIHAEGFAGGELKHGPLALVDGDMHVVALAPRDELFPKIISATEEVKARGGNVLLVSDTQGIGAAQTGVWQSICLPAVDPVFAPILYALPLQLLAYHTAVHLGTDVDQPRNLAKSVTVE